MSFGKSKSKQQSTNQSQSQQAIDPAIQSQLNANLARTQAIADRPYTPYTGQVAAGSNGNIEQAAGTAQGLLGFNAPTVNASTYDPTTGTAAQIDRSKIGNVNAGLPERHRPVEIHGSV